MNENNNGLDVRECSVTCQGQHAKIKCRDECQFRDDHWPHRSQIAVQDRTSASTNALIEDCSHQIRHNMSLSKPSACLFCTFKQVAKRGNPLARRQFHVSSPQALPRVKSSREKIVKLPKDEIEKHYSPEQAAAIQLTQQHLDSSIEDMHERTNDNWRPWAMRYQQDMTQMDPVYDKAVKQPWTTIDPNSRLKTEDELDDDMVEFMQNMPTDEREAEEALMKFLAENRVTVGRPESEFDTRSALAPQLPKMSKSDTSQQAAQPKKKKKDAEQGQHANQDKEDINPALIRLMQMTGFDAVQLRKLRVKSMVSHRVVNQTRLGKIQKQYWLSVAGNGNGLLGVGEGKSEAGVEGMLQSQYRAIRNMVPILRYEARTIFGTVEGKSGATELSISARPPGE